MADKRLLSYNPLSGVSAWHAEEDGKDITVYEHADIEPALEHSKALRNDESVWKTGVKNEMALYAHIPDSIVLKMWCEDGVNVYDKHQASRVFHLINTKYPACKTTTKHHEIRE